MKINCFKWLLLFAFLLSMISFGQKSLEIGPESKENLRQIGPLFISKSNTAVFKVGPNPGFSVLEDDRSFFHLDFNVRAAYIKFQLTNPTDTPQNLVVSFSYPFLEDAQLFRLFEETMDSIGHVGLESGKKPTERTWQIQFSQAPNQSSSYVLVFNKSRGKPLSTDVTLYSTKTYGKVSGFQNTLVGMYLGLTLLSIFFALFIFGISRYSVFFQYGIYLLAVAVYMGSFLGYTNLFLPLEKLDSGRIIYGLSIDISTITFALFAQKLLQAKKYVPKLKRLVEGVIIVLIFLRMIWHLNFDFWTPAQIAFFIKSWYGIICFLVSSIVVEILLYLKHNRRIGAYFALSYLFMTVGSVLMILHHSFGLLKISFYGLSHILFASMIEIVFLSTTMALVAGKIYQDRNKMANQLVMQQQKFLNAFVQGQEEERKRLGMELHDNIGSRLAHLKRMFGNSDTAVQKEFDLISEEVRNMAHSITPSELTIVGLPEALKEFLGEVSDAQNLDIHFNTFQFPRKLEENITTHLFRIVQELLQNVVKHANATLVNVQLFGHENSITLSFEDDGRGMDQKKKTAGLGLRSISSRVSQMNGQFIVDAAKGRGTSILVIIPTKYT